MNLTAIALGVDPATLYRWIQRLREDGYEVGPVRARGKPPSKVKQDPEVLRVRRNERRRGARKAAKKGLAKARMMR